MKTFIFMLIFFTLSQPSNTLADNDHNVIAPTTIKKNYGPDFPDDQPLYSILDRGFVPDEKTAIAVAEAVLAPIFGMDHIKKERPYKVTLTGETWTISGSLPEGYVGGVFEIKIAKQNGSILEVSHSR